jgi:Permuted papain-like amidase enzyme, YaeF/YiiX, C92 family
MPAVNLKSALLVTAWVFTAASIALAVEGDSSRKWQDGDIVFSSSERGQGEAIIAATGSPITHCGLVFSKNGKQMVLEAVQPVGVVALAEFISRSKHGAITALRLKTPLSSASLRKAQTWAEAQIGKNYDARFLWDDDRIYCSELVWKFYQHAGIELCAPRHFRDYDLEKPAVKKIIEQRFGGVAKLPLGEQVVAPSDLAASPLLMEVPAAR